MLMKNTILEYNTTRNIDRLFCYEEMRKLDLPIRALLEVFETDNELMNKPRRIYQAMGFLPVTLSRKIMNVFLTWNYLFTNFMFRHLCNCNLIDSNDSTMESFISNSCFWHSWIGSISMLSGTSVFFLPRENRKDDEKAPTEIRECNLPLTS